jgi:hypothetical protein
MIFIDDIKIKQILREMYADSIYKKSGEEISPIYKNPSWKEIYSLPSWKTYGTVRAILNIYTEDVYVFDGGKLIHEDVIEVESFGKINLGENFNKGYISFFIDKIDKGYMDFDIKIREAQYTNHLYYGIDPEDGCYLLKNNSYLQNLLGSDEIEIWGS